MWFFVEWTLVILITLFIFSQIVLPAFSSNLRFFWIFKPNYKRMEDIKEKQMDLIEEEIIVDQNKLVKKLYKDIETKNQK